MTGLIARAVLVAAVAALALSQLDGGEELLAWELVLLGIVIWELRRLPGRHPADDPPLFDLQSEEPRRLPRAVSSIELGVIDAVSGHLSPERRLQPTLRRIAGYRLRRLGVDFDTPDAVGLSGRRNGRGWPTPERRHLPPRCSRRSSRDWRGCERSCHRCWTGRRAGGTASRQVERAVIGKRESLELVLMALLADGHVLIEDLPGLAKTLLARSFAAAADLDSPGSSSPPT